MEESIRSQGRQTGTNQDILNLLKQKYGFDMDLDEEDEDEIQYEEPDMCGFSSLRGEANIRGTSDPRQPLPTRQYTLDLSELRNEHTLTDEGKGESESDMDDTYPSKGFQARHNTLNLSEFQEEAGLPQDQCSPPGFLEALEEGLRRRKVTWRLSSEEDSSPGNEEHQEMGASENVQQEPKVGDSPEVSDCCGEDRESDCGSSASQTPTHPTPYSQAHTEDQGAEQGDFITPIRLPGFKLCPGHSCARNFSCYAFSSLGGYNKHAIGLLRLACIGKPCGLNFPSSVMLLGLSLRVQQRSHWFVDAHSY